ncbi:head GIN domain-containing protein [Flavisolibacter ginsenosidimutans]|uniref:DUF2807 domain-containing protein n=1 Tax=Flavisolibacter ginsenosidimutans TaxID=661481 RepID=A0A5B8UGR7_9BACT|nr:head GIN domain-containing protein [Flavisolibacter ginsenosidimutans]QEC55837.1 DUF2807 domain-containing protein [Flavisolibacter ginsenosidimutans]
MKKLFLAAILLCLTALTFAQKVINDPNVEARKIGSFSGVSVSGGIDLYLSYGDEAIAVSASKPELRDRIKTEIENGVLKIWFDSKSGVNITWNSDRKLKAYVSYKTLNNLSASGGSDVLPDGVIKSNELKLHLSGGSDFKGKVEVENLRVDQSGGSDVHIAGKANTLSVEAHGGSDFNGYDLITEICNLEASGGSDIEVTANKELSARAAGASDIHYKGQPNVKEAKASGASSVKSRS